MFGFVRKLLRREAGGADEVARLAADPQRNDEFLRALLQSNIFILSRAGELATNDPTEDQVLAQLEESACALQGIASLEQVQVLTYDLQGHTILPFFSSQSFMEAFVQSRPTEAGSLFHTFELQFTYLLHEQFASCHLVLNPYTSAQRYVTAADRKKLFELYDSGQAAS